MHENEKRAVICIAGETTRGRLTTTDYNEDD